MLIDNESSLFTVEDAAYSENPAGVATLPIRFARRLVPSSTLNIGATDRFRTFERLVAARTSGERARVLIVGGGKLGDGMAELEGSGRVEVVETDIYISGRVDVACDGHQLPFRDGVFDGVVIQAVLEHVVDPVRVVSEIHRVLAIEGIVYAETPFMQQVHEGAFDFTRYTELGHRRLFRMFALIDSGVAVGPASALLWSMRYFGASLPRSSSRAARLLEKAIAIGFFWLKYLDRVIAGHPGAHDAASGVYFLGSRASTAVADREIVAGYKGIISPVGLRRGLSK